MKLTIKTAHLLYVATIVTLAVGYTVPASAQQWQYAGEYGGNVAGFSDAVNTLCTDATGNVYVTGNYNSSINFGNGTATLTANTTGTKTDGFVAKFNAAGLCQWAINFGGAATDAGGLGIITDGTTVYITGSSQFPCTIGSTVVTAVGGSTDGIVFALNASTGALVWAKAFGGAGVLDKGQAICMDNAGHIYITGTFGTRTTNATASFGAAGAFPRTVQGNISSYTTDLFVAQLTAATGVFNWVSTGGAASQETPSLVVGNDNVSGSGIAFLPTQNQLVIAGSFANANATYYSNGSSTASVSLTNAGQADICILRMDLAGNFLTGLSAGGPNPEEALAITYDATTSAAYLSGYFNSASVSGAFSVTNSSAGFDEVYYARYEPVTNTIAWAKSASGSASGNDYAFANDVSSTGMYITGRYQSSISFPGATTPFTATSVGSDDVFLVKVDAATGNAIELATAGSTTSGTDAGVDVAVSTNNNIWVGGIFAGGTLSFSPSSSISVTAGLDAELFIARYNDPPPVITSQPVASITCLGLSSQFTVVATGSSLTYQWQESTDAAFTAPTSLTSTGIYSGATTATLTISDNTTVNGKYYRVIISNGGGTVYSNAVQLNATMPTLPAVHTSATQAVNTVNNLYYGSTCQLIDKVAPSGVVAVTGSVTSEVWVESSVPRYGSNPFVQRHYQIIPATNPFTATGTVTLYFSQAEFDAFNAAPGSVADLPTGAADNAGKANLRIGQYKSTSNNASGLPGSYTPTPAIVIDPVDANITFNAVTGLWQVTFDVTGFGGFFVQTSSIPLPLNLLAFAAQVAGADVIVNWKTDEEVNHDHFELERSADGRSFTSIAPIAPLTGSGIKYYSYTDAGAAQTNTPKLFYRLKMVSQSGAVEYSQIVIVNLTTPSGPVTRVGPNPFHNNLEVGLYLQAGSQLMIQLTDQYGRRVVQETLQAPKGFSTYIMNKAPSLTPGMYVLTVNTDGATYSFKIVKE